MAFNSDTYHANKYAKSAWANLGRARELKIAGETARCSLYARIARTDMRLSLSYRMSALDSLRRRISAGVL